MAAWACLFLGILVSQHHHLVAWACLFTCLPCLRADCGGSKSSVHTHSVYQCSHLLAWGALFAHLPCTSATMHWCRHTCSRLCHVPALMYGRTGKPVPTAVMSKHHHVAAWHYFLLICHFPRLPCGSVGTPVYTPATS